MKSDQKTQGGCLCGAVRYDVNGPLRKVSYCHCGQCQKSSGHYFAATGAARSDFTLTEDRGLKWYKSSPWAERGFCSECGSNLFWRMKDEDNISILAGSIDGNAGLEAEAHIFVKDKKDYYEITDGLPQYDTYPGDPRNS
ncbi:MAG: GFA family protein [Sneathiella sp.]